jgi:hypothetical protein
MGFWEGGPAGEHGHRLAHSHAHQRGPSSLFSVSGGGWGGSRKLGIQFLVLSVVGAVFFLGLNSRSLCITPYQPVRGNLNQVNQSNSIKRNTTLGRMGVDDPAYFHSASSVSNSFRTGIERGTGPDKSREGAYETAFFDVMSNDARSPNNLLYHHAKSAVDSDSLAVHQTIWDLQHPRNCNASKLLILSAYHHAGLGSTLHARTLQLLLGLEHGRVVVDDPNVVWDYASKGKEYCTSTGFDCYFLPLSNCSIPLDFRARGAVQGNNIQQIRSGVQWVFHDKIDIAFSEYAHDNLMPKNFGRRFQKSSYWWMSHIIRYIVRPNTLSVNNIIKPAFLSVFPAGVPEGLASVFVRWGDKHKEIPRLESVDAHLKPLLILNISKVYIGSDSQKAIDKAISGYGHAIQFFYLKYPRAREGFVFNCAENPVCAERNFGTSAAVNQTKRDLMELYLSIQGDVMTGELGSNWCRLGHELHDAVGKSRFPYYPIGECGAGPNKLWCVGD